VIDTVNKMAAKQGIKSLKVRTAGRSEFLPVIGLQRWITNPTITKTTTILIEDAEYRRK
jgi:hypothetical protein